jgi:hypothetical protein
VINNRFTKILSIISLSTVGIVSAAAPVSIELSSSNYFAPNATVALNTVITTYDTSSPTYSYNISSSITNVAPSKLDILSVVQQTNTSFTQPNDVTVSDPT